MLPNAMNSLIVRNNDTHHYNTRQNHHLRGSRPTCKPVVNSFSNGSVQLWNAISGKLNINVSLYKFKLFVKLFLLPIYVKNTLALSTTTDLQQLALEADRIFLSGQPDNSTLMSTTTDDSTIEVSRIQRNNSKHHTSRTLCFFHERFRSRAKKCVRRVSKASRQHNLHKD